jgi:uncharacterized membrane protein
VIVDIHPGWATSSYATDVNMDGWISGFAEDARTGLSKAVVWSPSGAVVTLGTVPGFPGDHKAYSLNQAVEVAGVAYQTQTSWPPKAVSWLPPPFPFGKEILPCASPPNQPGVASVAFGISNLGRTVGWCGTPSRAWTSRQGSGQLLPNWPGAQWAVANAVNTCGTAVGVTSFDADVWTRVNASGPSGAPVCDQ